MWSEKRGLEGSLFFAIWPILWCIVGNISYNLKSIDGVYSFTLGIPIKNSIEISILPLIIAVILAITNLKINVDEERLFEINQSMLKYKVFNLIFIVYIIFSLFILRDKMVVISALIMEVSFICIYIIKRKIKSIELTDIQLKWRKAFEYPEAVDKESNLFWRLKPKFSPHVKVSFKERVKGIRFIYIMFLLIWWRGSIDFFSILIILLSSKELIYLLEVPLGLYTKTTGLCTGVVEKSRSKSNRVYYEVYVTDYENNNEVVFKVDEYCYIKERDTVTIIHGAISKKVIKVEGMRLNIL